MSRVIGPTGLIIFQRIMGLIIATIGVEFILDGVAGHFPQIMLGHD